MLLLLSAVERAAEAEGLRRGAAGRHCVGRRALLLGCVARGMTIAPSLAVGDGALGFWKALRQVFPTTREQRRWAHKTANVLDRLPRCGPTTHRGALGSAVRHRIARELSAATASGRVIR